MLVAKRRKMKNNEIMKTPESATEVVKELKSQVKHISNKDLRKAYAAAEELASKFKRTGQEEAARLLYANTYTFNKEQWLIDHGYTRFIQKGFLEDLVNDNKDSIYLTSLSRFERPLPEEAIKAMEETREIFDEYFVLYTDYTGREDRRIEAEKRERDPILLGAFKLKLKDKTETREYFCRRVYVLAEWEDAWCDLRMEKLLEEYELEQGQVKLPFNLQELEKQFYDLIPNKEDRHGNELLSETLEEDEEEDEDEG